MASDAKKILLVEDEKAIRDAVAAYLEREGYWVVGVGDGQSAIEEFEKHQFDLVVLDLMLPKIPGERVCRTIRDTSDVPIIMLTAKGEIEDRIIGLELGADDYLAKPFHLAELHARIRSVMRRHTQNGENNIKFGNVTIHPDTFKVEVNGQDIDLGRKEYEILHYLVNRANRLIEKQTLAEGVWGDDIDQADNFDFIYAQIKNLRKKLKTAGADIEIKTIYGFGYKLIKV